MAPRSEPAPAPAEDPEEVAAQRDLLSATVGILAEENADLSAENADLRATLRERDVTIAATSTDPAVRKAAERRLAHVPG